MKNRSLKIFLSVLLVLSMVLSLPGAGIYALAADDVENAAEETAVLPEEPAE